jgi:hypothetical protein
MDNLEPGEIVYCDITYEYEKMFRRKKVKEQAILTNIVFGREYNCDYPILDYKTYKRDIHKINPKKPLQCSVKVVDLHIHARTGFKNRSNKYTEVKRNEQVRNKITGAYE